MLGYFQALGTAIEGTYVSSDAKEKPAPEKRPLFMKPPTKTDARTGK